MVRRKGWKTCPSFEQSPREQNAPQYVIVFVIEPQLSSANSIFGNQKTSPFGSKSTGGFTDGKFSIGGPSVLQTGFGAFKQSSQKEGRFGLRAESRGTPTFGGSPVCGAPATLSFGSTKAPFVNGLNRLGLTEPLFGQRSSFADLTEKRREKNASKPCFGFLSDPQSDDIGNLFGNQETSLFWSKSGGALPKGGFITGGCSVLQSGFGAFEDTSQKPGGSSLQPSIGENQTFGGPAVFSSTGAILNASLHRETQGGFAKFAPADVPTFNSLASQYKGCDQNSGYGHHFPQESYYDGSVEQDGTCVFLEAIADSEE